MNDFDAFAEEETGGGRGFESRHLRSTILALRQALEDAQALRENIEGLRHEHRDEIQRLIADAQGEAVQLRAAASILRERLEDSRSRAQALKQEALAAAASEIRELRKTCQSLRDELDSMRGAAR